MNTKNQCEAFRFYHHPESSSLCTHGEFLGQQLAGRCSRLTPLSDSGQLGRTRKVFRSRDGCILVSHRRQYLTLCWLAGWLAPPPSSSLVQPRPTGSEANADEIADRFPINALKSALKNVVRQ